eukprot:CAMPEP_0194300566 /NCGR_PEP_ID=MMETSP0169-20130528/61327_1 /TAXON_ID=218684 /ORGANISM="Corethron pennatum, Strain L29A3" /LENGTH=567 /DNA_ID=CAMNT_0039050745 /DNA_START=24 /DNA_END=1727 /DNA_ORIENTATION=-
MSLIPHTFPIPISDVDPINRRGVSLSDASNRLPPPPSLRTEDSFSTIMEQVKRNSLERPVQAHVDPLETALFDSMETLRKNNMQKQRNIDEELELALSTSVANSLMSAPSAGSGAVVMPPVDEDLELALALSKTASAPPSTGAGTEVGGEEAEILRAIEESRLATLRQPEPTLEPPIKVVPCDVPCTRGAGEESFLENIRHAIKPIMKAMPEHADKGDNVEAMLLQAVGKIRQDLMLNSAKNAEPQDNATIHMLDPDMTAVARPATSDDIDLEDLMTDEERKRLSWVRLKERLSDDGRENRKPDIWNRSKEQPDKFYKQDPRENLKKEHGKSLENYNTSQDKITTIENKIPQDLLRNSVKNEDSQSFNRNSLVYALNAVEAMELEELRQKKDREQNFAEKDQSLARLSTLDALNAVATMELNELRSDVDGQIIENKEAGVTTTRFAESNQKSPTEQEFCGRSTLASIELVEAYKLEESRQIYKSKNKVEVHMKENEIEDDFRRISTQEALVDQQLVRQTTVDALELVEAYKLEELRQIYDSRVEVQMKKNEIEDDFGRGSTQDDLVD